jgi:hypothetical protein
MEYEGDDPEVEKAIAFCKAMTLDPLVPPEYVVSYQKQARWLRELLHLRSHIAGLMFDKFRGDAQRPLKEYLRDLETRRNTKVAEEEEEEEEEEEDK